MKKSIFTLAFLVLSSSISSYASSQRIGIESCNLRVFDCYSSGLGGSTYISVTGIPRDEFLDPVSLYSESYPSWNSAYLSWRSVKQAHMAACNNNFDVYLYRCRGEQDPLERKIE